ncbi:MAG: NTP transferase domain-containing protein [Ignavibacteriota bacterium]|jgi:mannose-1-phosphate guanylyltransferase|nr:NTP transferase domain-containing protein [Ignavibacteriales bacterium]MBL1123377.1 mannose-1-phosphate guanylyltransferase [Ignavibacteriota bacterium]MBV6421234.1 Mannose-1-phosphate guanylyltransferase RfbM [Ignavibacteriaceae bacterium]MCE7856650.1 mannose-1-phosphate guanylyltransferase [Ignavibacteria bacterium CHB3]MEB2296529.1 mannose-1-phosphate guanylyltransferase [Ignavibacteria bacterium]
MELYSVIMAGGIGARFWPRSKKKSPKQLLKIVGEKTMIQETFRRLNGLVPRENILIVTNETQKPGILEQLPEVPPENIILEPFGRNTAACIGLASVIIKRRSPDAVTFVMPADHIIRDNENFINTLKTAAQFSFDNNALLTIGIQPTKPETGYGYIQIDEDSAKNNVFKVLTFAEKPNYSTAVNFIKSGDFFWNSGMFIWKINTILNEFKNLMPDLYEGLVKMEDNLDKPDFQNTLSDIYGHLKSISIDYGIMEKSDKVFLVKGNFYWSDVGSWDAVYDLSEKDPDGNVKVGTIYTDMALDSYIYSPDKFTAVIGLDNIIVINTNNALLICKRDKAQDVKNIIDYLKLNKLDEQL